MIRIAKFMNTLNISRDELSAREWLLGQGFEVVTQQEGGTNYHSVSPEVFDAIVAAKRVTIEREIERKQRELMALSDLRSAILESLRADKAEIA